MFSYPPKRDVDRKSAVYCVGTCMARAGLPRDGRTNAVVPLISEGFLQRKASACVFVLAIRKVAVSVHGGDFTATGPKSQLDWFQQMMQGHHELTVGGRHGPGASDDKEATVSNRVIRWTEQGVEYKADPCQVERLLDEIELSGEGVKGVVTPRQ